jgi:hypothetical protein
MAGDHWRTKVHHLIFLNFTTFTHVVRNHPNESRDVMKNHTHNWLSGVRARDWQHAMEPSYF